MKSTPLLPYEQKLGLLYGLFELFVLPFLLSFFNTDWQYPVWVLNLGVFALNFLVLCGIFHRFLWADLKIAGQNLFPVLHYVLLGAAFYFLCAFLVGRLIFLLCPDFVNPNDQSMDRVLREGGIVLNLATVLLVPVSEELLFRGILFRGLYDTNKVWAWVLSILLFGLVHISGYIGTFDPILLLLSFIQYVPAGLCLALAYRKAHTIVAPILLHSLINLIGISLLYGG